MFFKIARKMTLSMHFVKAQSGLLKFIYLITSALEVRSLLKSKLANLTIPNEGLLLSNACMMHEQNV